MPPGIDKSPHDGDCPTALRDVSTAATEPAVGRDASHVSSSDRTDDETATEPDPWIGQTLSDVYVIESRIGEGGMGAVYRARHVHLQKRFAVKVLAPAVAENASAIERLRQEAMAAARIDHENIVDVVNFNRTENGAVYVVMELLEGESLAECIGRGPLELDRALTIAAQICRALEAAHEHGIVHRDLKPENVFLTRKSDRTLVKVLDFGISKVKAADAEQVRLTRTGQLVGTPLYMSPEQARGETEVDRRVDVYAVGVILYEMLAGAPPFEGRNYFELLWKHGNEPPPSLKERNPDVTVPDALEAVIMRALAKDPDARFASMAELERALFDAAAIELDPPRSPAERSSCPEACAASEAGGSPEPQRPRWPLVALGLSALTAIGVLVYSRSAPEAKSLSNAPPPTSSPSAARAAPVEPTFPRESLPAPSTPSHEAAPVDEPPPPASARVTVELRSHPSGAEVRLDDRLLGTTPLLAPFEPSERGLRLTFSKPGYIDRSISIVPSEGITVPAVRLRRRAPARVERDGVLPIKTGL